MRLLIVGIIASVGLTGGIGPASALDKTKLQEQRLASREPVQRPVKIPSIVRGDWQASHTPQVAKVMSRRENDPARDKLKLARLAEDGPPNELGGSKTRSINNGWVNRSTPPLPPISQRR